MENLWKKGEGWYAGAMLFVATAGVALAQAGGGGQQQSVTLTDPLGGATFTTVVNSAVGFLFYDIATPLCAIMVLVGAFQMMTSAGDPEKFSTGRKTITYAAVGFVAALLAGSVTTLIVNFVSGK